MGVGFVFSELHQKWKVGRFYNITRNSVVGSAKQRRGDGVRFGYEISVHPRFSIFSQGWVVACFVSDFIINQATMKIFFHAVLNFGLSGSTLYNVVKQLREFGETSTCKGQDLCWTHLAFKPSGNTAWETFTIKKKKKKRKKKSINSHGLGSTSENHFQLTHSAAASRDVTWNRIIEGGSQTLTLLWIKFNGRYFISGPFLAICCWEKPTMGSAC